LVDVHVLLPPTPLLTSFEESVRVLRQQVTTLLIPHVYRKDTLIQNGKLRAARDLLLPRLMSGELAV
jgi:type I restriction enzyme S subunit